MRIKLILIGSILAGILFLKLITPEVYHGYDAGFYRAIYLLLSTFFLMIRGSDRCWINFISFPAIFICLTAMIKKHRNIYQNKVMVGYLIISHF